LMDQSLSGKDKEKGPLPPLKKKVPAGRNLILNWPGFDASVGGGAGIRLEKSPPFSSLWKSKNTKRSEENLDSAQSHDKERG